MFLCVLNKEGRPLMPTTPRKARLLLESGRAQIVRRVPFTIQLLRGSSGYRQPVRLGVDAGHAGVGFSAVTAKEELLGGELTLLPGMSKRLEERATYRSQRRGQLRHRASRFDNRRRAAGWLAPSIQHKLDTHVALVETVQAVLSVTETTVEVANFDIQQIKAPGIEGVQYQQGEQAGYWNLREYILHRDGHACQNPACTNRAAEKILEVHHLGYWRGDRSDRPTNLITLCNKCHAPRNHLAGQFLHGWQPALKGFKPETFMSTVRWRLVNRLGCRHAYGYQTKSGRIALGLPKSHHHDAFVIAGGTTQTRVKPLALEQVRRNNRALATFYDAKYVDRRTWEVVMGQTLNSGRRKRNLNLNSENLRPYRARKVSKGRVSVRRQRYPIQAHDLVQYAGQPYAVIGLQHYGEYVALVGLPKSVKVLLVSPLRKRKGLCEVIDGESKAEPPQCLWKASRRRQSNQWGRLGVSLNPSKQKAARQFRRTAFS